MNEAKKNGLAYSVVRFGNVLGSRGSVVRTFEKQIASGGPITVTDKEMKRYFMTIPEATQLVLQASYLNKGGEIYVLDMGKPVRIYDLARDMIQFSGLKYKDDIDIVFTGNRPGEKLFEELFLDSENYNKTENNLIYVVADAIKEVDPLFEVDLSKLLSMVLMRNNNSYDYTPFLKKIVPEFQYHHDEVQISL